MVRSQIALAFVTLSAMGLVSCFRLFGTDCIPGTVESCSCPDGRELEVVCPARCECDEPGMDASPDCGDGAEYPEGCGDGVVCPPEECDDGRNGDPCDGCLDTCEAHVGTCGDALLCGAEICDDGVNDGSLGRCASDCAAGPPARLSFLQEPSDGTVGVAIAPSTSVVIEDDGGRRVRGAAIDVSLALERDPTGGVAALAGNGPAAAVDGLATFPALVLDTSASGYVLRATAEPLAAATSVAFTVRPPTSWPPVLTSWQHRKRIAIRPGAPSASLRDFPLLISLDGDPDLRDRARSDGFDIRFTDGAGDPLSHEIDSYVGGTGTLLAWVRIPSLDPSVETVLYMYYGNPAISTDPSDPSVWSNGYLAVWHLAEAGRGTPDEYGDATGNGNDATGGAGAASSAPARQPAAIGMGQSGDGVDDFIATPLSINDVGPASVSLWAYVRTVTNTLHPGLIGQNDALEIGFYWADRLNVWTTEMSVTCPGESIQSLCTSDFPLGSWFHVAVSWDGTEGVLYVDGVEQHRGPSTIGSSTDFVTIMGRVFSPTGHYLDGIVDEVRLADVDRPAAWFALEHANQGDPGALQVVGAEEHRP
jgi:hypothetical protein